MRLAALFSGGKDSAYALYQAQSQGHIIDVLVSIISENPESYMYHVPNIHLVKLQAEALEIPLIARRTKGEKEKELLELQDALNKAIKRFGIEGVVSGAIYSNYQRKRIDDIAMELGIESLCPLWKRTPKDMLSDMVRKGFKIVMSAVAAEGLGPEWLGRVIDEGAIEELSVLHNTCYVCTGGEGGEFETLVLDAPNFKKRIKIETADTKWDGKAGVYNVISAVLEDKN